VTGWISDAYAAAGSEASLRDALLTILALNVLSLPALVLSARFYEGDVLRASQGLRVSVLVKPVLVPICGRPL